MGFRICGSPIIIPCHNWKMLAQTYRGRKMARLPWCQDDILYCGSTESCMFSPGMILQTHIKGPCFIIFIHRRWFGTKNEMFCGVFLFVFLCVWKFCHLADIGKEIQESRMTSSVSKTHVHQQNHTDCSILFYIIFIFLIFPDFLILDACKVWFIALQFYFKSQSFTGKTKHAFCKAPLVLLCLLSTCLSANTF